MVGREILVGPYLPVYHLLLTGAEDLLPGLVLHAHYVVTACAGDEVYPRHLVFLRHDPHEYYAFAAFPEDPGAGLQVEGGLLADVGVVLYLNRRLVLQPLDAADVVSLELDLVSYPVVQVVAEPYVRGVDEPHFQPERVNGDPLPQVDLCVSMPLPAVITVCVCGNVPGRDACGPREGDEKRGIFRADSYFLLQDRQGVGVLSGIREIVVEVVVDPDGEPGDPAEVVPGVLRYLLGELPYRFAVALDVRGRVQEDLHVVRYLIGVRKLRQVVCPRADLSRHRVVVGIRRVSGRKVAYDASELVLPAGYLHVHVLALVVLRYRYRYLDRSGGSVDGDCPALDDVGVDLLHVGGILQDHVLYGLCLRVIGDDEKKDDGKCDPLHFSPPLLTHISSNTSSCLAFTFF